MVVPPEPRSRPFRLGDPPEEHSLLIIGYDGSQFVFFDPDSAVSSTPEAGFGMLFHDSVDDRFSTARSPASLPVDSHGKHATGDKRYQIISIRTE